MKQGAPVFDGTGAGAGGGGREQDADRRRDTISPTDRKLIDEAVAAGRVRKIPTGVSGIPLGESGAKWTWPKRRRPKQTEATNENSNNDN